VGVLVFDCTKKNLPSAVTVKENFSCTS